MLRTMRAPTGGSRSRRTLLGATPLLLLLALGATGCAKRFAFTPAEMARVETEADLKALRVYPNKRMLAVYDQANVAEVYAVNRQIVEASDRDRLKEIMTKNTAGIIVAREELNGKPLLWVTFEPTCAKPDCAYGWVETEDRHYRLVAVPDRQGFAKPKIYRSCVWKRRLLGKGKLQSLAEANEVFLVKKNNGKLLTLELEVKKVVDDRTKTRTRRARGVD